MLTHYSKVRFKKFKNIAKFKVKFKKFKNSALVAILKNGGYVS